jgi:hypothetical protein
MRMAILGMGMLPEAAFGMELDALSALTSALSRDMGAAQVTEQR